MCVKIQKQLNPEAEEWRPISAPPPPPPCAFILPSPPPLQLVVGLHYHISFPAKKAAAPPPREEIITHRSPNSAPKRFLPPRLRRAAVRARNVAPRKLEWRPKNAPPPPPPAAAKAAGAKTTLMIKNIPNQLRRDFMLKFLDGYCKTHSLEYDFFYLPIDFKRLGNLGYAFVNFTTAAAAAKMMKLLSNYKWRSTYVDDDGEFVSSRKVCAMKWARIQGKEALVRRFSKSCFNCDEEEFLPVVLDPPRNGSDPNPPRPITLGRLCGPARRSASL